MLHLGLHKHTGTHTTLTAMHAPHTHMHRAAHSRQLIFWQCFLLRIGLFRWRARTQPKANKQKPNKHAHTLRLPASCNNPCMGGYVCVCYTCFYYSDWRFALCIWFMRRQQLKYNCISLIQWYTPCTDTAWHAFLLFIMLLCVIFAKFSLLVSNFLLDFLIGTRVATRTVWNFYTDC